MVSGTRARRWEALIFVRHHRLDNLTLLVDLNGLQGFGTTREVADLEPLAAKFRAFGLPTLEVDGHDPDELRTCPEAHGDGLAGHRCADPQGPRSLIHGRPDGMALSAHD